MNRSIRHGGCRVALAFGSSMRLDGGKGANTRHIRKGEHSRYTVFKNHNAYSPSFKILAEEIIVSPLKKWQRLSNTRLFAFSHLELPHP